MRLQARSEPADLAARLQVAIPESGLTIRSFQETLHDAGVANSTYSSVFRYVKGEVGPPLDWIQAAARVLKRPPEWLAFGVSGGSPWDAPARGPLVRALAQDPTGLHSVRGLVGDALTAQTFPVYDAGRDLLAGLVESLVLAQPVDAPTPSVQDKLQLARQLELIVHQLLGAIGKSYSGRASSAATLGVLAALLGFVPEPQQGNRIADIIGRLPRPLGAGRGTLATTASDQEEGDG